MPLAGLKQELFHRHKEAQQCCRPHNLPLLRAAQQREMEVRGAGLEVGMAEMQSCVPSQDSHSPVSAGARQHLQRVWLFLSCSLRRHQLSWLAWKLAQT